MDSSITPVCYAVRLVRPFLPLLARRGKLAPSLAAWLDAADDDARLPAAAVDDFLARVVEDTGDVALGLEAAARTTVGDGGVLAYAMGTAPTLGSALALARRTMRLLNDDLILTLRERDELAEVSFDNQRPVPRAVMDYQLCAMIRSLHGVWPRGLDRELVVHFEYPRPQRLATHQRVLGRTTLRFAEPCTGFRFPRRYLTAPMRHHDPRLHGILVAAADRGLAQLPAALTFAARVRSLVCAELPHGAPSSARVARRLDLSLRTFVRRLHDEGTTYAALLDELRRNLAHHYLVERGLPSVETALLTGFAQTPAFHRAFRRWTGTTPAAYQRAFGSGKTRPPSLPARATG